MENSFQTSFIPKKPITSNSSRPVRPPTSIFTVLAFLVLIFVGIASGGLLLYKNYLINQKQILSVSLEKVRDSFEKDTIDELELYDKRVSAARRILDSHIILSPMFALLGSLTLPEVQYTTFSHQSDSQGFSVKISGTALDYKSIALQADVFNSAKGRLFKNVVFSNLTKEKGGNVNFNLDFNVDPALLSYEKNMALEQLQAKIKSANTPQPSTPAPSPDTTVNDNNPPATPEKAVDANPPANNAQPVTNTPQ